ncbi:CpsD/CapB family tyrosine-protein kinase, partial [bacterium]|nr:CpsD/CapB family tyrosine-protein kinase [bacterium]
IIAQAGKSVILLDADLRKPSIHSYLGISNSKGLSDVFRGSFNVSLDLNTTFANWEKSNVNIITGGSPPPNPSELLGSKKMDQIIENLKKMADVIIIDGPPLLVADAIVLSKKVDGVLVVVRHGYTNEGIAKAAMEQLKRAQARILGVVYNQIPTTRDGYPGMYRYYNKYYISENGKEILPETAERKQSFLRWFKKSEKAPDGISPFDDIFKE